MNTTKIEKYTRNNTTNHEHEENHNNYNYYYSDTHPGVRVLSREDAQTILEAYIDNVNENGMTGAVAKEIEHAYQQGLSVEEIVLACEETGFAPRPSAAYLREILRRWAISGVTVIKNPVGNNLQRINKAVPWWKNR